MRDLIAKIDELKKTLSAMKPKESPLVPALKLPSVKPLSMPAASSSGGAKMPGIAPPSGKDPKKMAEQLKNPRPKKPKLEMLKVDKNGQWSLEKDEQHYKIHVDGAPVTEAMPLKALTQRHGDIKHIESSPHNKVIPVKAPEMPKMSKNGQWSLNKNWSDEDYEKMNSWQNSEMDREALESVPKAKGKLRSGMLNLLGQHGESRLDPKTGKREYKLYRHVEDPNDKFHHTNRTSWSSHPGSAYAFASEAGPSGGAVMHSWIPEHHIHSYLPYTDDPQNKLGIHHSKPYDVSTGETEAIVEPHDIKPFHVETGPALKTSIGKTFK